MNGYHFILSVSYLFIAAILGGCAVGDSSLDMSQFGVPIESNPPNGIIDSPAAQINIEAGDLVNFSASGTSYNDNISLTYHWSFGVGSGIRNSILEDPGVLVFNKAGTYTVIMTVTDSRGIPDPTPAQIVVTVLKLISFKVQDNVIGPKFFLRGDWAIASSPPDFFGEDYNIATAGDGSAKATWRFTIDSAGTYDITTRWIADVNRATNAPYLIYNNGILISSVQVNQQHRSGMIFLLDRLSLADGKVDVVLSNNANGSVIADVVQMAHMGPPSKMTSAREVAAPAKALSVVENDMKDLIAGETGSDNNASVKKSQQLEPKSNTPPTPKKKPEAVNFTPSLKKMLPVVVTGRLAIPNPEPTQVLAIIIDDSIPVGGDIIDNSDTRFSSSGTWQLSSTGGGQYGSDYLLVTPGDVANVATWKYSVTTPGIYEIYVRWTADKNRTTNAQYSLVNNSNLISTVQKNQSRNGGKFVRLGEYALQVGVLEVILKNHGHKILVADALRICKQYACPAPLITSPSDLDLFTDKNVTVKVSAKNMRAGWGVEFVLNGDDSASIKDNSMPYEQLYSLSKSEHTVDVYVVDETGVRLNEYADKVNFGVGDLYVALGDSITVGSGDDVYWDNISEDQRVSSDGYITNLNNQLTKIRGYPHKIVNAGVSGHTSAEGLARVDSLIAKNRYAQFYLIFFGTNDASIPAIASGLGLAFGDSRYANSYKANMQQIIDKLNNAGKTVLLTKIPYTQRSDFNLMRINEYNQVIDELVVENTISVVPPDLYSHFEMYQDQQLSEDKLHPNGEGYRSIADLWATAITAAKR